MKYNIKSTVEVINNESINVLKDSSKFMEGSMNSSDSVNNIINKLGLNKPYKYKILVVSTETDINGEVNSSYNYVGGAYDITDCVSKFTLTGRRDGSATSCDIDMSLRPLESAPFPEGSLVNIQVNDKIEFIGFVFKVERNRWGNVKIRCYDSMRYLKNQIYVFLEQGTPGKKVIETAVQNCGLSVSFVGGVTTDYKWDNVPFIQYNKEALDIITWVLSRSVYSNDVKKAYYIRSSYQLPGKTIEIGFCENNIKPYTIGNKSLLSDFTLSSSIDESTANKVVIIYDRGADYGKLEAVAVNGVKSQAEYGLLTLTKEMPNDFFTTLVGQGWKGDEGSKTDQAAEEYVKSFAQRMLDFYNRPFYTLNMRCIGIPGLRSGDMLNIDIEGIGIGKNTGDWANVGIVDEVIHYYEENNHYMDIKMTVGVVEN